MKKFCVPKKATRHENYQNYGENKTIKVHKSLEKCSFFASNNKI